MNLDGRSLPEIRALADEFYRDHDWAAIEALPDGNPDEAAFKVEAWARNAVAEGELPEGLDYLRERSRAESWRVRERVAMALKYVNANAFEQVADAWVEWVDHDDNYVRRACEVGLMGVRTEHADAALRLLDHLVSDSDDYVQKSCGGFAVSTIANRDPDVGREYLERWSRSGDLRTRWNVAKAVGGAYGQANDHAVDARVPARRRRRVPGQAGDGVVAEAPVRERPRAPGASRAVGRQGGVPLAAVGHAEAEELFRGDGRGSLRSKALTRGVTSSGT